MAPRRPPATVNGQHDRSSAVARFNARLAIGITRAVGSMWCAYLFALLALLGLPAALAPGGEGVVSWIAQTFLQLVLLAVILVGTNVQAAAADKRASDTWNDTEQLLGKYGELYEVCARVERLVGDTYALLNAPPPPVPGIAISADTVSQPIVVKTVTKPRPRKPAGGNAS